MWPNPQGTEDLATFIEQNLTGKLHFLWSGRKKRSFPLSSNYSDDVFKLKDFLGLEKT